jgi:hypothetical protein
VVFESGMDVSGSAGCRSEWEMEVSGSDRCISESDGCSPSRMHPCLGHSGRILCQPRTHLGQPRAHLGAIFRQIMRKGEKTRGERRDSGGSCSFANSGSWQTAQDFSPAGENDGVFKVGGCEGGEHCQPQWKSCEATAWSGEISASGETVVT